MQLIDAFTQCQLLDDLNRAGSFHQEAISNLPSAAHLKKQVCFADCAKHHQIGAGCGDKAHLLFSPGVKAIDANHQLRVRQPLAHCLDIASLMIREKESFASLPGRLPSGFQIDHNPIDAGFLCGLAEIRVVSDQAKDQLFHILELQTNLPCSWPDEVTIETGCSDHPGASDPRPDARLKKAAS